ncbi:MAG: insulinase family protein [Gemmatimonadales bacterium]|nr:insulinase family protein [Gemmatimonadales bacterium]
MPFRAATRTLVSSSLLAAALAVPLAAQQKAPARAPVRATKVATVEGITEYSLPNGLRVLLFPDPSKASITVNITYFVGSRHESYGETGMAHLLEHLVFKGTPKHPDIPKELSERGASPNGTTWTDRTNYYETFPASDANLEWALDLEADRMVNSFIAARDLASEMTVVRNEFEMGENDPVGILEERVLSTAYLWHNYGKATIGARSDLEHVPIERLQAFYRKYYQPDNAMLVVAGRFDPDRALAVIARKFGPIPRPKRTGDNVLWDTYTRDPAQDGEREVTLRRVGDVQALAIAFHVPASSHPDYAAVRLLAEILGGAPAGRLHKALVEPGLAASVSASTYAFREPTVLVAKASVRKEASLPDAERVMRATIDSLLVAPPTADELERARAVRIKAIERLLRESDRVGLALSEPAASGDWRLIFLDRDRTREVTAAEVQRVARTYLKPENRTLGRFIPTDRPDRVTIPGAPDVASLVKDYRGDTTLAVGEAFDPTPANVDARTTRATLPSGLRTAYLPKQTRGQSVVATLSLRYGTLASVSGKAAAADMAGDMLLRGTTTRSRQQVKDEFDRLKASVALGGGPLSLTATVTTTRPNLVPALRLLAEVLKQPAFDEREFEQLRQQNLAAIEEQRSDPTALAFSTYQRLLAPYPAGHPRATPSFDEQLAEYRAVRLADARAFHAEFVSASHGELAVVGDFDRGEVDAVARELFGSWTSPAPFARVPQQVFPTSPQEVTLETPDKANAFFVAGQRFPLRDDHPDYAALVLGDFLIGGGFLDSRLIERLRQKEGLSYYAGSQFMLSSLDPYGEFMGLAIHAPENRDRVAAAFREEMDRAVKQGFTAAEVAKGKEGLLQARQLGRSDDAALAGRLALGAFLERPLAWDAELEARIRALTPEQVNRAVATHIDPAKFVTVRAGDFAKTSGAQP